MAVPGGDSESPKQDMFSPVSSPRVSQVIVDQIKALIREGSLHPGDRLPSERELCQRFGVSRVTVREALRVLEASGLVTIRVGARGGAFLTTPSTERLGADLADLLSLSTLTAGDVTEARMIVELGALPLAVERATDSDLTELFDLATAGREASKAGRYTMEMSAAFHIRVAECAHNPALTMLIQSFHRPLLMSLREARVAAPLMGHRGSDEHMEVVEAIKNRDPDAAMRVMSTHLDRTAQLVKSDGTPP